MIFVSIDELHKSTKPNINISLLDMLSDLKIFFINRKYAYHKNINNIENDLIKDLNEQNFPITKNIVIYIDPFVDDKYLKNKNIFLNQKYYFCMIINGYDSPEFLFKDLNRYLTLKAFI